MKLVRTYISVLACLSTILLLSACGAGRRGFLPVSPASLSVTTEEALAELEALPVPNGVSAQLFGELRGALAAALKARGVSKFASSPPSGASNQISDFALIDNGDGTYSVSWHYRNVGDYDQSGTVSVSDITPIAMLYGQDAPNTGGNTLLEVVNGSGSGKIGVADITPIAMNFGVSCGSFILEASQQAAGIYAQVQVIPFSAAQGLGRKLFLVGISNTTYKYYRVRACDADGNQGAASNYVVMPDPPPPVAPEIASVSSAEGYVGDSMVMAAVVTGDEPLAYAWDFGGGATPNTSSEISPTVELGAAGDYPASLTVSNEAGEDVYAFTVSVYELSGRGDWWTYRHDPQLSGRTAAIGPTRPKQLWKNSIACATSSAVVDMFGRIGLAGSGWFFRLLNPDGSEDWSFSTEYDLKGTAAITENGSFLVGSSDGNLYCLRSGNGEIDWSFPAEPAYWMMTPAVAPDGTIAIFSFHMGNYGSFFIITPNGELVLQVPAAGATGNIAVGLDGNFYWATNNAICGYDTAGNQVLMHEFERKATDWIESLAVNQAGELVVQANYSICAYDTGGGMQWFVDAPSGYDFNNAAAIGANGEVYVFCHGSSSNMRCYDSSHSFAWQYPCANDTQCPPIVDGEGKVYFGDKQGNVVCLDASGAPRWNYTCTAGMENRASLSLTEDGVLLVPSTDNNLYAIGQGEPDPGMRGPWWTWGGNAKRNSRSQFMGPQTDHISNYYECDASLYNSSPIIGADGTVYVGTYGNSLYSLIPDLTDKNWSVNLGTRGAPRITQGPDGSIFAAAAPNFLGFDASGSVVFTKDCINGWRGCPMVDDLGRVFGTDDNGNLHGYGTDSSEMWSVLVDEEGNFGIALGDDGKLYYADNDGKAYSFDPASGSSEIVYSGAIPSFTYGIAIRDDGMLMATATVNLTCINPVTKSLEWWWTAPGNLNGLPAIAADGSCYIGCADGKLYKVNAAGAGSPFYDTLTGSGIGQCTIDAAGTVYFGAGENVFAVKSDGALLWQHAMPASAGVSGGPAIAPDGTMYVGAGNNFIYAFKDL